MILCITPSPDIERTWIMDSLRLGDVHHVKKVVVMPSGKGVNVARAVHTLGGESLCAGFLGGFSGRYLESLIQEMSIPAKWTWITGETRTALAIIDSSIPDQDATLISESSPPVSFNDWDSLYDDVLAVQAEQACICGRLPENTPPGTFTKIIQSLESRGTEVWVDASGESLMAAISARPTGIKVNAREAGGVTGRVINDERSALLAANDLGEKGIKKVALTLGKKGSILKCWGEVWFSEAPVVKTISSVGSGDAFLAGMLYAQSKGESIPEMLRMAVAAGAANALTPGGGCFDLQDFKDLLPGVVIKKY